MRRMYLTLIVFIFVLSIIINLIVGHERILPLGVAVIAIWANIDNLGDFLDFDKPYTGIAIVKTVLVDEDIAERKKSFHTDLFLYCFFSLLFAFK